jgi:hypothetical protein
MKLNLIVPNAHYDNEHGQPKVIEKDNDGSFLYRYNIKPEMKIPEGEEEEKQVGFSCCEIRVWEHPTKAVLKKAIIRSVIDETAEFDLVNSYNKDLMGIKKDSKAIADYTEYLQFTEDVDAMLVNDLSNIQLIIK